MTFSINGLDHIMITAPTGSQEEAREFFTDILLCKEIKKSESLSHSNSLWFELGNQTINVGFEEDFCAEKRGHPGIDVNNIDALMAHFEEKNMPFEEEFTLPHARRFFTNAFFGHRMEFLEWQKVDS